MALTKRDFEAIARELNYAQPEREPKEGILAPWYVWRRTVAAVASGLRYTNPKFDTNRFIEACIGEKG